jgi:signal transduction histidine kinase
VVVRLVADEREVELTVADDGEGIEEHAAGGAGVGLLAARERARAAGGAVELRRRPGGGTELSARLPIGRTVEGGQA